MNDSLPKRPNGDHDWIAYRRLVLQQLDDLKSEQKTIKAVQVQIRLDVRGLKVKAAIWGGGTALFVTVALSVVAKLLFGI